MLPLPCLEGWTGSPNAGIALQDLRCWRRWSCALTFIRIWGERSLHCILIIVRSGGSRNFGTVMACWPDGICCSDSFRSRLSTDWEFSMLMRTAYLDNVASACGRIVRYHCQRRMPVTPDRRQRCWTNCSLFGYGGFDGCQLVARTVQRNVGGSHLYRRVHCWSPTSRVGAGRNSCTSAWRNVDHGSGMGSVGFGTVLVGLCWAISGVTVLAA